LPWKQHLYEQLCRKSQNHRNNGNKIEETQTKGVKSDQGR